MCFNLLDILNGADINIGIHVSALIPVLNSFLIIPESGIAKSFSNSMFNFLKTHQDIFHSG